MKIKELIERLSRFDPDDEVRIEQPSHNYWRQLVAAEIDHVEEMAVDHSDYLRADQIVKEDDEESRGKTYRTVVVIH